MKREIHEVKINNAQRDVHAKNGTLWKSKLLEEENRLLAAERVNTEENSAVDSRFTGDLRIQAK